MRYYAVFSKVLAVASGLLILASALLITYSAFARFLFNMSSTWKNELSIYFLMASVWLGAGPTMLARRHVSIQLLSRLKSPFIATITHVFSYAASIVVGAVIFWKGADATQQAIEGGWHASTSWGPSLVVPYLIIPIGMFFFVVAAIINLIIPFVSNPESDP